MGLALLLVFGCTGSLSRRQATQRVPGECLSAEEGLFFQVDRKVDGGRVCVLSARDALQKRTEGGVPTIYGPRSQVLNGLDVVAASDFRPLSGRHFALLTNATGLDTELNSILELLLKKGLRPDLILEPEHGLYGALDSMQAGPFRIERETGIRVLSLYSQIRKPLPSHLVGIDTIVVDIQNLPVRCYTYASTLTYLLEAAEQNDIEVLILDRPHPYGMFQPAGGYLEEGYESFVGIAPVPFLYSMSPGEYALFLAHHRLPRLKLRVVKAEGFHPDQMDWVLAASWINPSPNIPDLESALVYAGFVLFEGTNVSLGRGTTRPFVYSGAPWVRARAVVEELKRLDLKGVRFAEVSYTPTASLYAGVTCHGVQFHPYSKDFDPVRTGYEYMRILKRLHPHVFRIQVSGSGAFMDRLWGGPSYRSAIMHDLSYEEFRRTWVSDATAFRDLTREDRIYGE